MSRRRRPVLRWLLLLVLVPAALVAAAFAALLTYIFVIAPTDTVGDVHFDRMLPVPPLARSTVRDGVRTFTLDAREGRTDLGGARPTRTWGFDGDVLGPTLRARRGERVRVRVTNHLPETTSVHWHGMHLPAKADGGPHQPVRPGRTWTPSWTIDQPAATLWYHPHIHGRTAQHVYRGLAGMFLLDDEPSSRLDLPDDYGVDDVPVVLQDKQVDADGTLDESSSLLRDTGLLGDTVVVNGAVRPRLTLRAERTRLRLLNASNARVWNLGFADGRSFALVGTDGGLLERPHTMRRLQLSPGERAEVVVTARPGDRTVLRSYPVPGLDQLSGGHDRLDVLELRAGPRLRRSPSVPSRLVDVPRLREADAVRRRSFRVTPATINGRQMDMGRIDAVVTVGDTEVWTVRRGGGIHNFHVHDVQFQVLDVAGRPPPPELAGWKDTVWLPANGSVRLILRFTDYTDPDMPYMFHCHVLRHEDQGAMGQFVVVRPGERPGRPPSMHH